MLPDRLACGGLCSRWGQRIGCRQRNQLGDRLTGRRRLGSCRRSAAIAQQQRGDHRYQGTDDRRHEHGDEKSTLAGHHHPGRQTGHGPIRPQLAQAASTLGDRCCLAAIGRSRSARCRGRRRTQATALFKRAAAVVCCPRINRWSRRQLGPRKPTTGLLPQPSCPLPFWHRPCRGSPDRLCLSQPGRHIDGHRRTGALHRWGRCSLACRRRTLLRSSGSSLRTACPLPSRAPPHDPPCGLCRGSDLTRYAAVRASQRVAGAAARSRLALARAAL